MSTVKKLKLQQYSEGRDGNVSSVTTKIKTLYSVSSANVNVKTAGNAFTAKM